MINISVVIPVYNVAAYIKDCMNSVLQQTMTEGVECILVDDCGPDNSMEIVEDIAANYQGNIKINIIHHDKNKGVGGARNTGLKAAQGEYVFFMDSDDNITSDCLESLWNVALKYPKAELVHGVEFADNQQQNEDFHLCINKYHLPEYSEDVNFVRRESILNHYAIHAFNCLIKKDFLVKNEFYFIEGVVFEDFPWMMDVSQKVTAVALLAKDTYYYRQHGSSIMGTLNPKWIQCVANNSDYMLNHMTLGPLYKVVLFRILEFMHIYDVKFETCPLDRMQYGKNWVFSKLYRLMYSNGGFFGKLEKELLIKIFKIMMKQRI